MNIVTEQAKTNWVAAPRRPAKHGGCQMTGLMDGFARGGAWGAVMALILVGVELAPLFLR